jgi:hypothetical protein
MDNGNENGGRPMTTQEKIDRAYTQSACGGNCAAPADGEDLRQLTARVSEMTTQHTPTPWSLAAALEQAKREITEDVSADRVPVDVADFSALHDHVAARN